MFSFIYMLLFAVWVFVMNSKIQHGPEAVQMPTETTESGLLEAAARLANPAGYSMLGGEDDLGNQKEAK